MFGGATHLVQMVLVLVIVTVEVVCVTSIEADGPLPCVLVTGQVVTVT